MLPPTGKKCRGSMPDFCQTMSSLEPVLKAYEGPDTLFLYNFNADDRNGRGNLDLRSRDPGGARRSRTDDILLAKQALYQLSYGPVPENGAKPRRAVGDCRSRSSEAGRPGQTRTADLTLIRRTL